MAATSPRITEASQEKRIMGIERYDRMELKTYDDLDAYGAGFKAGMICTLLFVFILAGVAAIAHEVGRNDRGRSEKAEAE
jgi:hypothetical protein